LKALRHEPFAGVQTVAGHRRDDRGLQAVAEWIAPGHEARACWCAHRLGVELSKLRASRGQLVDIRRFDIGTAIETDILPANVVGNDVHDVCLGALLAKAKPRPEQEYAAH